MSNYYSHLDMCSQVDGEVTVAKSVAVSLGDASKGIKIMEEVLEDTLLNGDGEGT